MRSGRQDCKAAESPCWPDAASSGNVRPSNGLRPGLSFVCSGTPHQCILLNIRLPPFFSVKHHRVLIFRVHFCGENISASCSFLFELTIFFTSFKQESVHVY